MQLLDAGIAFVMTIAGLATVVSIIVEIIHRVLSLRAKGLRAMLEQHFKDVIQPVIKRKLQKKIKKEGKDLETELKSLQTDLIDKMTANPLRILQELSWLPKRFVNSLSQYNEVTALEFIRRLPETKVYELIELPGEEEVGQRLAKFDKKYQEYEKAISNYFKRRAQLLSFMVGIALAIAVNIHGIRLFERYLNDPELTATVIAQTDKIESAMVAMQQRQASDTESEQRNIQEIRSALNQYNELMGNFLGLGIPIGWEYYPNCPVNQEGGNIKTADPRCQVVLNKTAENSKAKKHAKNQDVADAEDREYRDWMVYKIYKTGITDPLGTIKWFFVVIITGTLIGLGGPFWFDVASKLSDVRRKVSGGQKPEESVKPEAPDEDHAKVIEKIASSSKSKTPTKKRSRNTAGNDYFRKLESLTKGGKK